MSKANKNYFILVLMLYVFGVALRVLGQLMNNEPIKWKETFLLGELDGSQFEFNKRWFVRVSLVALLPAFFINSLGKK